MHLRPFLLLLALMTSSFYSLLGQASDVVTYAGSSGKDAFMDVVQISDGSFLVGGYADDLSWINPQVPTTEIPLPNILNGQGSNRFAFIIQYDSTLQNMEHVVHFPQGAAEDVRFIKLTNAPGEVTGDIYISGNTSDSKANNGGYFISRLNNNFVDGVPTGVDYATPIWAEDVAKEVHPWDVGSDGKVVFVRGQAYAFDWSSAHRLDANGEREVVPGWRNHWPIGGGEYRGDPLNYPNGGIDSIAFSGIVFKRDNRCNLRSWTSADYNLSSPDGNGGTKKGKWPLDILYDSPCDPDNNPTTSGPGYTGYQPSGSFIYGASAVTIDRRTNKIYLGMNFKSVLPGGNPDFEPAVLAMDSDGWLEWWSRLYHEITPNGDTMNSTPDQYVDGLAIDYSQPESDAFLVVDARCHGNNVENLWEGNAIAANPAAAGFQNRFTGTNGNIHISWLGKLKLTDGTLFHSTYVAEYAEGTGGLGSPHPDANLDGWPNPNGGWPNVNTTRLTKNALDVTADGSVCILGTGRRTITTANAHQKMVKPGNGGLSAWNQFVRVYEPDLGKPAYSSLVVGQWDTLTQQGGGNTKLLGQFKTQYGIVAVGYQEEDSQNPGMPKGEDIPVTGVPNWGSSTPSGQSAILVHYTAPEIFNADDCPVNSGVVIGYDEQLQSIQLYPNPTQDIAHLQFAASGDYHVEVVDLHGSVLKTYDVSGSDRQTQIDLSQFASGVYMVRVSSTLGRWHKPLLLTR